jgi:hypothetical protein
VLERHPEVSTHGAPEEAEVLHPQRIVEAEERAELPDILFTRLERQEEARGISGEMQEPEHDHGHAEEDEDALHEPPQHVANHVQRFSEGKKENVAGCRGRE